MRHRQNVSNDWIDAERTFGNLCAFVRAHKRDHNAKVKLGRTADPVYLDGALFELGRLVSIAREAGEL